MIHYNIKTILIFFIVFCVDSGMCAEQTNEISILKHKELSATLKPALLELVKKRGQKEVNNFYIENVILQSNGDDYYPPWIYWKEENKLILYEATINGPTDLTLSRRFLDLKKDVVSSQEEMHGSTYLITEKMKNTKLDRCYGGTHFTVNKNTLKIINREQ